MSNRHWRPEKHEFAKYSNLGLDPDNKPRARDWRKLLSRIGAIAGEIAPYFVEKFGFSAKTPITVFTGDNPSSLVGMLTNPEARHFSRHFGYFFCCHTWSVADPSGYGHVFGKRSGGSMSLQCFINGSLAREEVKDKFRCDWEQFSSAFENTSSGNENLMVPFFRPEISPRLSLKNRSWRVRAFISWKAADAAIRCGGGQAINIALHGLDEITRVICMTGALRRTTPLLKSLPTYSTQPSSGYR